MIANFRKMKSICQEVFYGLLTRSYKLDTLVEAYCNRSMGILKNKWFILGNILLLLIIIPVTLFVVKQQTDLRSKAAPSTNLSFQPATAAIGLGETASFDIFVDPGQNIVSILDLTVSVDPEVFEIVSLERNETAFPVSLKAPDIQGGTVTTAMSTSNDVARAIQAITKAATLTVRSKKLTDSPSVIKFDTPPSQAFSLASADGETENVLQGGGTASVTVTDGSNLSPTPTGGVGGTNPTGTLSPTPSANQPPVCTALSLDRSAAGAAPYTIIFTATGSDNGGAISNASFNFGDGPAQSVTSGGGIGTGSVNVQIAHTFTTAGTYNVTATLTDNTGLTSATGTCTQSVTISQGTGGSGGTGGSTGGSGGSGGNSAVPTLPVTGTFETALMVAGAAAVAIVVGAFLFIL